MTELDRQPKPAAAILWAAGIGILALNILIYAITYRAGRGPDEDAILNELNMQSASEDSDAVADDIRKTNFERLDQEMPELEALLSP